MKMDNPKRKALLIGSWIVIVIAIMGIIVVFTPKPMLHFYVPSYPEDVCHLEGVGIGGEYELMMENNVKTTAISKVCFYSDDLDFMVGRLMFEKEGCYHQRPIHPDSIRPIKRYNPQIFARGSQEFDSFTIKVNASCTYKVLGVISLDCDSKEITCTYQRENENSTLYKYMN